MLEKKIHIGPRQVITLAIEKSAAMQVEDRSPVCTTLVGWHAHGHPTGKPCCIHDTMIDGLHDAAPTRDPID